MAIYEGVYKVQQPPKALLFLDFDGVLHPSGASAGRFCMHVSELTSVLERSAVPVGIVVSSSWRQEMSFEALLGRLGSALAPYVLGCTPALPRAGFERVYFPRSKECAIWRTQAQLQHLPWRALDDCPSLFVSEDPHLIVCNPSVGLQPEQCKQLSDWLDSLVCSTERPNPTGTDEVQQP